MYIWIVIGNGFRYGLPYLYGSAALALFSFYTVAYFSPYYRANYGLLGLGTFLLAVVIPVYLGSLLKALRRNLEAARAADRLKTRFLANVSHDLRTPLNAIIANCELLTRDIPANSGLELRDMQEAATTLNKLVSDLLDVAKLEDGRISVRSSPFNLPELLGRSVRLNEPAARQNGTRIYLTLVLLIREFYCQSGIPALVSTLKRLSAYSRDSNKLTPVMHGAILELALA